MNSNPDPPTTTGAEHQRLRRRHWLRILVCLLAIWALAAYLVVPWLWKNYFRHHPDNANSGFSNAPRITQTGDGHPGDPINIALVGTEAEIIKSLTAAGWFPADPITFRTSLRIAADTVFRKPDDEAPVSNLYLFGRKQDLAFEQPIGDSPRQRHHVRFWRSDVSTNSQPVWLGSATFDERVGLSYTTGQVTHHIGPDVDAERDRIVTELQAKGWVQQVEWINDFHPIREGRNGGGDPWHTDGRLAVVILRDPPGVP